MQEWFDTWVTVKQNKDHHQFADLEKCIKGLRKETVEGLLRYLTKDSPSKREFCLSWTDDSTHILCGRLYTDLREWLGATGKKSALLCVCVCVCVCGVLNGETHQNNKYKIPLLLHYGSAA